MELLAVCDRVMRDADSRVIPSPKLQKFEMHVCVVGSRERFEAD